MTPTTQKLIKRTTTSEYDGNGKLLKQVITEEFAEGTKDWNYPNALYPDWTVRPEHMPIYTTTKSQDSVGYTFKKPPTHDEIQEAMWGYNPLGDAIQEILKKQRAEHKATTN